MPQPSFGGDIARGFNRFQIGARTALADLGVYSPETAARENLEDLGDITRYPEAPGVREGLAEITGAQGLGDIASAIVANPRAVLSVVGESLGLSAPGVAGALGTTGLGALMGGPAGAALGGRLGLAIGAGLGGGATEFVATYGNELREAGVDVSDPIALENALNDPVVMGPIVEKAKARAGAVGAVSALAGGVAGLPGAAVARARPGATGVVGGTLAEIATQGALEAAGEAAAQEAAGEPFNLPEVVLEGLAGGITELPLSAAGGALDLARQREATREVPPLSGQPEPAPAPAPPEARPAPPAPPAAPVPVPPDAPVPIEPPPEPVPMPPYPGPRPLPAPIPPEWMPPPPSPPSAPPAVPAPPDVPRLPLLPPPESIPAGPVDPNWRDELLRRLPLQRPPQAEPLPPYPGQPSRPLPAELPPEWQQRPAPEPEPAPELPEGVVPMPARPSEIADDVPTAAATPGWHWEGTTRSGKPGVLSRLVLFGHDDPETDAVLLARPEEGQDIDTDPIWTVDFQGPTQLDRWPNDAGPLWRAPLGRTFQDAQRFAEAAITGQYNIINDELVPIGEPNAERDRRIALIEDIARDPTRARWETLAAEPAGEPNALANAIGKIDELAGDYMFLQRRIAEGPKSGATRAEMHLHLLGDHGEEVLQRLITDGVVVPVKRSKFKLVPPGEEVPLTPEPEEQPGPVQRVIRGAEGEPPPPAAPPQQFPGLQPSDFPKARMALQLFVKKPTQTKWPRWTIARLAKALGVSESKARQIVDSLLARGSIVADKKSFRVPTEAERAERQRKIDENERIRREGEARRESQGEAPTEPEPKPQRPKSELEEGPLDDVMASIGEVSDEMRQTFGLGTDRFRDGFTFGATDDRDGLTEELAKLTGDDRDHMEAGWYVGQAYLSGMENEEPSVVERFKPDLRLALDILKGTQPSKEADFLLDSAREAGLSTVEPGTPVAPDPIQNETTINLVNNNQIEANIELRTLNGQRQIRHDIWTRTGGTSGPFVDVEGREEIAIRDHAHRIADYLERLAEGDHGSAASQAARAAAATAVKRIRKEYPVAEPAPEPEAEPEDDRSWEAEQQRTREFEPDTSNLEKPDSYDDIVNGKAPDPDEAHEANSLLIMPCCQRKKKTAGPAIELYDGPLVQTLRRSLGESLDDGNQAAMRGNTWFISAEHGLVNANETIEPYERKMDDARAGEIEAEMFTPEMVNRIVDNVKANLEGGTAASLPFEDVFIAAPGKYRNVAYAMVSALKQAGVVAEGASVNETSGQQGTSRAQLSAWIGNQEVPTQTTEDAVTEPAPRQTTARRPRKTPSTRRRKGEGWEDPFWQASVVMRESLYGWAFQQAGVDPKRGRLLAPEEQWRIISPVLTETFGLKDVRKTIGQVTQKGRWMSGITTREALDQVLDAVVNLQRMTAVLELPNHAIGLDGTLALVLRRLIPYLGAFVHAGRGMVEGVPVSEGTVILPRRSNSFSHEWIHALDHHLGKRFGITNPKLQYLSQFMLQMKKEIAKNAYARFSLGVSRQQKSDHATREAFYELLSLMFFEGNPWQEIQENVVTKGKKQLTRPKLTKFAENALKLDAGSKSPYWATPFEMLARAGEAYVSYRMERAGFSTEFIGKGDKQYASIGLHNRFDTTFPKGPERARIFAAFDRLFAALAAEEVLGKGPVPKAPDTLDMEVSDYRRMPEGARIPTTTVRQILSDERQVIREVVSNVQGGYDRLRNVPNAVRAENTLAAKASTGLGEGIASLGDMLRGKTDPPPDDALSFGQRASDLFHIALASKRAALDNIQKRTKSKTLRELMGRLVHFAGRRSEGQGRDYTEGVRIAYRKSMNTIGAAADLAGIPLVDMPAAQRKQLRELLTSIDVESLPDDELAFMESQGVDLESAASKLQDAPDNIVKLAATIRQQLNHWYYELANSGHRIGYTRNGYLPRMVNEREVFADTEGFLADATTLYQQMYNRQDRGMNGGKLIAAMLNPQEWKSLWFGQVYRWYMYAYGEGDVAPPPDVWAKFEEFEGHRKKLRSLAAAIRRAGDDQDKANEAADKLSAYLGEHQDRIIELHDELRPVIREAFGEMRAEHWLEGITNGETLGFEGGNKSHGNSWDFLKGRKLPPEADRIMARWLQDDVWELLNDYVLRAARMVEIADRFGVNAEKLPEMYKKMQKEGLSAGEIADVDRLVRAILGKERSSLPTAVQGALSWVHTFGTMSLLPRSTLSSLAEPMTLAIRYAAATSPEGEQSGSVAVLAAGLRGIYQQLADLIPRLDKDAHLRREFALTMGVITNAHVDTILEARHGGNYGDTVRNQRLMARFFRYIGLHSLTRSQRVAAASLARQYIQLLSDRIVAGVDVENSTFLLDELGVGDVPGFAKWINKQGETYRYDPADPYYRDLETAVFRFAGQAIVDPTAVDRPYLASNPVGRLVAGIMSFNYAFGTHVIAGSYRREKGLKGVDRKILYAGSIVQGFLLLWMAQLAVTIGREFFLNPSEWERHEDEDDLTEWLLKRSLVRTGVTGPFDPLVNAVTGLKYDRDLANLAVGAGPGWALHNVQQAMDYFVRNSENTNTAEFNAIRALYHLIGNPLITGSISSLPAGPLTQWIYGAAMASATSPAAGAQFAEMFVGPKGEQ